MPTTNKPLDVIVIGGGVNGVGIALDAAGRGLNVLLCESHDLASATSSSSSKLIHGGLRYLEQYEFCLVKKALAERELLLNNAPHIMWPLRFRLPHQPHLRPSWMLRIGLFLYDNLAKRQRLAGSNSINFSANSPLVSELTQGFEYSDGWVDDARLVVLCAMAAKQQGADIKPRTRCIKARRQQDLWQVTLQDTQTGAISHYQTRVLVNAAGPWASSIFNDVIAMPAPKALRLVKGSHIVVPRLHDEPHAYILQNSDQRIVFVIPYEGEFSLIGTTDIDYVGDPALVAIDEQEQTYLCQVANEHFKKKISAHDIVWSYSGVRPLIEEHASAQPQQESSQQAQHVTRDYTFHLDTKDGAPLLSVFGGKLTTYRLLAEAGVNAISPFFSHIKHPWTQTAILPGGHFRDHQHLQSELCQDYPWLPQHMVARFVRSYGTLCHHFLYGAHQLTDLGIDFGGGLYQKEVDYLVQAEWAYHSEDILWRRSKLGLVLNDEQQQQLQHYLTQRRS
ncbi:glycerol-3-phosphate dehydrogenase [Oceanisphaera avium]|uniref:Glycerol-3-phosphate dehydrogenase n=1 Tax=Oceanisphaera avium TaxID=1903694 RepID=A0A1Y0CVP0_9GAMM|nr:glycerol-3-phosphate dehydrogenase [Oceanisphaera avium]ART79393.1 glycerol-3-phosphate dehydrogenase [Oceanisphaera avium]